MYYIYGVSGPSLLIESVDIEDRSLVESMATIQMPLVD